MHTAHAYVGGDIFIHAKSSSYSKLYELAQLVMRSFPEGSIEKAQDIYGWTYQEGRDLSGFIDGECIASIESTELIFTYGT